MNEFEGLYTTREIRQQPRLWRDTFQIISDNREKIQDFIERFASRGRIIFTGAGSSSFVGSSVAPFMERSWPRVESIPTTDIISCPENYLKPEVPTLLISCARSGNSPESVETVNIAEKMVDDIQHIVLTCNPEGSLARTARGADNFLLLMMPEGSNDQGFAMTGSFTTMVLASLLLFNLNRLEKLQSQVEKLSDLGDDILKNQEKVLQEIAAEDFERAVFLGTSTLNGLARESALKLLELTAGKISCSSETSLGFRHGPKSIVNRKTLIITFLSRNEHARKYEMDLLKELSSEGEAKIVAVTGGPDPEVEKLAHYTLTVSPEEIVLDDDVYLLFPYILLAQNLALFKSVQMGINPDDPSPDGSVNRVVRGVTIYPYHEEG